MAEGKLRPRLVESARRRIEASRAVVDRLLARRGPYVVYGVNTGFGKLADIHIQAEDLETLQLNLVRSHASGLGPPLSVEETRAMMLLRANVLALGFSGCRVEVVETLLAMLEVEAFTVQESPRRDPVGASGDLAPLAHLDFGNDRRGEPAGIAVSGFPAQMRCARRESRRCGWPPRKGWHC